jgi:hypothetical protein
VSPPFARKVCFIHTPKNSITQLFKKGKGECKRCVVVPEMPGSLRHHPYAATVFSGNGSPII